MNRLTTLTFQYYRSILLYNISFFVLATLLVLFAAGTTIAGLVYCKIISFTSAVGLHYFSSANTFFYYRNAGLSIRRLYVYALILDIAILLVLAIPFNFILHAATHIKG